MRALRVSGCAFVNKQASLYRAEVTYETRLDDPNGQNLEGPWRVGQLDSIAIHEIAVDSRGSNAEVVVPEVFVHSPAHKLDVERG